MEPLCEALIRNLHDKPFCETFMWNLDVELREPESLEPLFVRVEPLCGTLGNLILFVEPELLSVEHLCRTLGNLSLYVEPGNF